MKIVPSIASCHLMNIERELEKVGGDYDNLHVDIEDGNLIPNITFGFPFLEQLGNICDKPFSIHLTVSKPEEYMDRLLEYNCSHIFIPVENQLFLKPMIQKIHKHKVKAGLAFQPISSLNINNYSYLFSNVDSLLFMTSEPELGAQNFDMEIFNRIPKIEEKEVWIDGGITELILQEISSETKIDYAVVGRGIFYSENPRKILEKYNKG